MIYNIKREIGRGSCSIVYEIEHDNKKYAMKKVNLASITQNQKKYILSELRIISEHNSPYLIKFYNSFVQDDNLCIVMEYCEKGTLYNIVKNNQLDNKTIWKYFSGVCGAVEYLHKHNIIHRDIKATNILIDNYNNIKLIDFGISKILNNYLKFTKSFVGTPECMSPELLKNIFYDYKVDIWALGIILYFMTHKKTPFECKTMDLLREKILNGKYIINDNVYGAFKTIITRCIQISPHKRIKLETLLKYSEIKKHIKYCIVKHHDFEQIDKVPSFVNDWNKIVNKIPNKIPIKPETRIEKKHHDIDYNFMKHYTKNDLVYLNTRLINTIVGLNIEMKKLENELKNLKCKKV